MIFSSPGRVVSRSPVARFALVSLGCSIPAFSTTSIAFAAEQQSPVSADARPADTLRGEPDHPIVLDAHTGPHRWIDQQRRLQQLRPNGEVRFSTLAQFWLTSGFGDRFSGAGSDPRAVPPPGRDFSGGFGDPFRFRRLQFALDGYWNPRVDYRVMIDPFRTNNQPGGALQDLWIGYQIGRNFRVEAGQQKTGLSEEGTRDDGELLTVERSVLNSLPIKAGRIGDVRDIGLVLRYNNKILHSHLGYWKDNGAGQSDFSRLGLKFLDGSLYYSGIRHITFGLWGGTFVGQKKPAEARERGGATLLYQTGPHTFEGEIAYARDYAAGAPAPGRTGGLSRLGYLLYAHSLSSQWQLVTRYENADPANQGTPTGIVTTENGITIPSADHKLKEYTFGVNYFLPGRQARVQLDYIREDGEINSRSFFGKPRTILLSNFQMRF